MRQVPTGVKILAAVYIVLAVLSILWSLLVFGFGGLTVMTASIFGSDPGASFGSARVLAGVSGMAIGVLQLVVGIGLLTLKRWAWILAVIAAGITLAEGIIGMFGGGLLAFCCGGLGIAIPAGIVVYLFRGHVRKLFGA